MSMHLNTLTLKQTIAKLKRKEISHAELYRDVHDAIASENNSLNIYLSLDNEAVAKAEKKLDTPLAGAPIAVKDNYVTQGLPTTASSNVLKGFMPPYESTVTSKLRQSGGIIVGKTNMDAWAHGSSTETSDFGPTKNPRNPQHLPGGSSGGSAAAIAANLCAGALGTETAGSIRQPAAWCGVVGMKPTYGRVSRTGVVAMASSTDSPGPIGKTVEDCAMLFTAIAGNDRYDGTTSMQPIPDLSAALKKGVKGLRIGVCYIDHPKLKGTPVDTALRAAAAKFELLGATIDMVPIASQLKPKTILTPDYAIGVYTVVQRSEVSSNLARYDGVRFGNDRSFFGAEAKRRIMLGTFTLSSGWADRYYVRAQKVRSLYRQNYRELFERFDVLISPTSPGYALSIGASKNNPMFGELEDMLLEPSSITGLPGISVPMYHDPVTNLFLGMNIVGNMWQEETVVRAAHAYEQATVWNEWAKKE